MLSPVAPPPSQVTILVQKRVSKSEIIIIVALVILIFLVTVGGAYLWWTASRFGQRSKRTNVMIASGTTGVASTPFTNQYLRTTSGYWTDAGDGVVSFSTYPQQSWSFNGQFLTNDLTFNTLSYNNTNGQLSLSVLPSGRTNRTNYSFIFTGQSLITASSASSNIMLVVTDTSNTPALGQLVLYQNQTNASPTPNQILNLSAK